MQKRKQKGRRGFTILELMIAATISSMLVMALVSTTIFSARILKGNFNQQQSVREGRNAAEFMGQMVRQASRTDFTIMTSSVVATPAVRGNRVDFKFVGEAAGRRRIDLSPGADNDIMTPWDNTLTIDPNTTAAGDERTFRWFSPSDIGGAFTFVDGALLVSLRRGDPAGASVTSAIKTNSDAQTGMGQQGVEMNVRFSPRNADS